MPNSDILFKKGKLISGIIYPEFFPIKATETVLNIGCGDGVQAVVYKGNFKKMVGIDINESRLEIARQLTKQAGIPQFEAMAGNVERINLHEQFDKAIAVDIIEHVLHPDVMLGEVHRLLKNDGQLLITFPVMHDRWIDLFRFVGRKILRRQGSVPKNGWDPDAHEHDYPVKKWISIVEQNGFTLVKSRASTLWPPLHFLGWPRFWFSNQLIHAIDNFFCGLPAIKNYGQALVCIFDRK